MQLHARRCSEDVSFATSAATMELRLQRSGDVPQRPCRGVSDVMLILELRIAQMSGCSMRDVSGGRSLLRL